MTSRYGRKWRGTKKPLDESEREERKVGLKLNIQKTKIMASGPITSWQIDGETMETVTDFYFGVLQNHCRWWLRVMKLKDIAPWKKSYDQPRQCIKKQRLCQQKSVQSKLWFLQYSCWENPRGGGPWWAAVYGVAQSRTQLKWLSLT